MSERRGLKYIWRTVPRAPSTLFQSVKDVHPAMVQVMFGRGLDSADLCEDFLAGICRDPDDPGLLADLPRAIERLVRARERGDLVAVFTDYDADGVNAVGAADLLDQFDNGVDDGKRPALCRRLLLRLFGDVVAFCEDGEDLGATEIDADVRHR